MNDPREKWYGLPMETIPANGTSQLRRRRTRDEPPKRVPDQPYRASARQCLHLFDSRRQILLHVIVDAAAAMRTEMARTSVPAQVEVEDVVSGPREVVREAPRRQMPRVAILPEPVHEQDRGARPLPVRGALAHHREGHPASGDDDFFSKRGSLVSIDQLLDDAAVKNHS